jgi:hypothetical protein
LSAKKEKRIALIDKINNVNDHFEAKEKVNRMYGELTEESIAPDVGGRAVRVKATVANIINQKPEMIGNSKIIKKKVEEEFHKSNAYKVYEKDLMNLDGIIKQCVAKYRREHQIKRSMKHISKYCNL